MKIEQEVYEALVKAIPKIGESTKESDLVVKPISSGWSNRIIKARLNNFEPSKFLVRIFGKTSNFVNKEKEKKVFEELSKQGIGIHSYMCTEKWRIEKFIDSIPLSGLTLKTPNYLKQFTHILVDIHYNKDLTAILEQYVPKKTPFALEVLEKWGNELIENFPKFISLCKSDFQLGIVKKYQSLLTPEFKEYYRNTIKECSQEIVSSHNDLNIGNFLHTKDSKLVIIDYEYMNFNPRAFDLSEFVSSNICESIPDFPYFKHIEENTLSEPEIELMCKEYLVNVHNKLKMQMPIEEYLQIQLPLLIKEVHMLMPIESIGWGIWALLSVDWSLKDDFKFYYAEYKLGRYLMHKK